MNKLKTFLNSLIGFRKLLVMLIIIMVGVIFRVEDMINGKELVDLMKGTGVAFFTGNLVEHITDTIKKKLG